MKIEELSNEELSAIIATNVMKWRTGWHYTNEWSDSKGNWVVDKCDFSPPTSDADVMMAWDTATRRGLIHLSVHDCVHILMYTQDIYRRRTMCICMVKAVIS